MVFTTIWWNVFNPFRSAGFPEKLDLHKEYKKDIYWLIILFVKLLKTISKHSLIILAGGFGTRLKSISNNVPKALMPIGDSIYLDLLLEKIFKNNINHVYLSLYYKPELFQDYIKNSIYKNKLITITEPEPLGTGGAVSYVIKNSSISSPFFVMNGDSMSNINLKTMYTEFLGKKLSAMIGITKVEDSERYGTVSSKDGKVMSFEEKGAEGSGWINNGVYIFKKDAFDEYSGPFSLENTLFQNLIQNQKLGAFKVEDDNFVDMEIPEDYEKLCNMYKKTK